MSDTVIRHYEKGLRVPKINTINKLANGLNVTTFELLSNTTYSEYFNKKYSNSVEHSAEVLCFIDYLKSLGYTVKEVKSKDNVLIELIKK